jgi:hypothetical protein
MEINSKSIWLMIKKSGQFFYPGLSGQVKYYMVACFRIIPNAYIQEVRMSREENFLSG